MVIKLNPHILTYFHGTWTHQSLGRVAHVTSTEMDSKVRGYLGSSTFLLFFEKSSLYPCTLMYFHGT